MIPNGDERIERQLYAAYRLILSWPKAEVRQQQRPHRPIRADDTDRNADKDEQHEPVIERGVVPVSTDTGPTVTRGTHRPGEVGEVE